MLGQTKASFQDILRVGSLVAVLASTAPSTAQQWDVAGEYPDNGVYHQPDYPIAFVAVEIREVPNPDTPPTHPMGLLGVYHHGTDVLSANNPDGGNHLWVLTPKNTVKKLFPLPEHADYIDTDPRELDHGSVLEPNVSEDGRRLYFSYVHDAEAETTNYAGTHDLPLSGADLYVLDIGPLVDDPDFPPSDLDVRRLTYRPSPPEELAMNLPAAGDTVATRWATTYMHAVEMRTKSGLKLVYASDERSLHNSNTSMSGGDANHNFNLHIADLVETGVGLELQNRRQFHYYTTTSAMSPTPLRNGVAFSYQASTTEPRVWHIQSSDSVGRWNTLLGYGVATELYHLGTFCVSELGGDDIDGDGFAPGDYFIGTLYYNQNNEGFGSLTRLSLDPETLGLNTYSTQVQGHGRVPRQVGSMSITRGEDGLDDPSEFVDGRYLGKFTSPRCGRPDELYMAYTPTSANGRVPYDEFGHRHRYRSYITYRSTLDQFEPLTDQKIVVRDSSETYSLVWPTPILSWLERTGTDAAQQFSDTIVGAGSIVEPGLPHAQVGTAELYNTDRRPFDCWLGQFPGHLSYSPSVHHFGSAAQWVVGSQDGLTQMQDGGPCAGLSYKDVLGVAINLTSNKLQREPDRVDYETVGMRGATELETVRLLGVYDIRGQVDRNGDEDGSFQALIPARVPFELHLLDAKYGLKLADVRSWHSLQPQEVRVDCGGCHQHEKGAPAPAPFETTYAAGAPPADFVSATPYLRYSALCRPEIEDNPSEAARSIPVWSDLWPRFDAVCSQCHHRTGFDPNLPNGLSSLSYRDAGSAYRALRDTFAANPIAGALGSPAFWAARGERTDGRSGPYSHDFATYFDLCDGSDPAGAEWVYQFGQWIDNHMPKSQTGQPYDYERDRFHPAVDFALTDPACAPTGLRIGFWDDSGGLERLELKVDDQLEQTYHANTDNLANGSLVYPSLPPGLGPRAVIEVIGTDADDNRQIYSKSIRELTDECS